MRGTVQGTAGAGSTATKILRFRASVRCKVRRLDSCGDSEDYLEFYKSGEIPLRDSSRFFSPRSRFLRDSEDYSEDCLGFFSALGGFFDSNRSFWLVQAKFEVFLSLGVID